MEFHYDWNIEVIAQFYATLFFEEPGSVRAMHWMTVGVWYTSLMMILLLDFHLGKQTKITLKFIFTTLLVKMR
jgi:hypothetical protein